MSDVKSPIAMIAYGTSTRNAAVAAALELIKAEMGGPSGNLQLSEHLKSLSEYADKIETALKKS